MAEVKYGQLSSWDDASVSTQSDFFNLQENSDNVVKVLSNPYQFVVHWVKDSTGQTRKIRCSVKNCPLCKKGEKAQYRWYIAVLDRKSAQPKVLEISQQIYRGVKDYVSSDEWSEFINYPFGKVMVYDLNIRRGSKGTNPLYTVIGLPKKKSLTDEEVAVITNFFERVNISKFTQPATPEEVLEKMGASADDVAPAFSVGSKTVTKGAEKPVVKDEDFDFGDDDK